MKLKYKNSDGTVLTIGHLRETDSIAGETVENFDGEIPSQRVDFYKRISAGVIAEKTQAEKDSILDTEKKFTKSRIKNFINNGATVDDKITRIAKILGALAEQIKESEAV